MVLSEMSDGVPISEAQLIKAELERIWNELPCLFPHHVAGYLNDKHHPRYMVQKFSIQCGYCLVPRRVPVVKYKLPANVGTMFAVRGRAYKLSKGMIPAARFKRIPGRYQPKLNRSRLLIDRLTNNPKLP